MTRTRIDITGDRTLPDSAAIASMVRASLYELAGRYVADHRNRLLAAWDGLPARGRGGTGEIVKNARRQGREVVRLWI